MTCVSGQPGLPDAQFVSRQFFFATPKSTQEGGDCKGILPKMPIDSGVGIIAICSWWCIYLHLYNPPKTFQTSITFYSFIWYKGSPDGTQHEKIWPTSWEFSGSDRLGGRCVCVCVAPGFSQMFGETTRWWWVKIGEAWWKRFWAVKSWLRSWRDWHKHPFLIVFYLEDGIPGRTFQWLITMVIVFVPIGSGWIGPLPNGLNDRSK